jgi:hypothetical protein
MMGLRVFRRIACSISRVPALPAESGSSPSDRRPATVCRKGAEAGRRGSVLPGLAGQGWERLAIGAGDGETGNRDGLHRKAFQLFRT